MGDNSTQGRPLADELPTREQLDEWATSHGHPAEWAQFFTGLPWKYIEPVATIAANTGNHPALALGGAAIHSSDPDFKAAAKAHLEQHDPARPNRAQRRAKRSRR